MMDICEALGTSLVLDKIVAGPMTAVMKVLTPH